MALNYLDSGNVYENQGSNEEEEERESEYANIGTARSSLKMDPLKEPGVKGRITSDSLFVPISCY